MKLGILGLPNVGKSTLFNAITSTRNAQAANYPFCTIEPNSGIVAVPDPRLDKLAEIWNTDKKTPATVEFVDIAGLVKGAASGAGLGNKFLGHIRECDALVHVVRCFDDNNIIHVVEDVNKPENVDPIRDIEAIDLELILSDLEMVSNRLGRQQKAAKTGNKAAAAEAAWLAELAAHLEAGQPARTFAFDDEDAWTGRASLSMSSLQVSGKVRAPKETSSLFTGSHTKTSMPLSSISAYAMTEPFATPSMLPSKVLPVKPSLAMSTVAVPMLASAAAIFSFQNSCPSADGSYQPFSLMVISEYFAISVSTKGSRSKSALMT